MGVTWEAYGERLDERLHDLEGRIHRGSYHPQPMRRVEIPKGNGSTRPLGIPALEFGRYARREREQKGLPKPETFTFLGFVHIAGRSRKGTFQLQRQTSGKKLQASIARVKKPAGDGGTCPL